MGDRRTKLKQFAQDTLEAIEKGSYTLEGVKYDLRTLTSRSKQHTEYYAPDSMLSQWSSATPPHPAAHTNVSILEVSTLEGARILHSALHSSTNPSSPPDASATNSSRIGILNFASARKPGGGFLSGAQAQEESLARASNLHPTLMTRTAQAFYTLHNRDQKGGFYTHATVFSPRVAFFRDDAGRWLPPLQADVVTSAAVNAGAVRGSLWGRTAVAGGAAGAAGMEARIAAVMRERMARVLHLLERAGVRHVVLGSFGTGVFRNDVGTVAGIWADLLVGDGARFGRSFENVVFAILGRETFETFRDVFEGRGAMGGS
ncbi:uncharacterized protein BXZ73DRAFT_45531 [Epithele typhae]|uniref:uncharacterized protein n=1 Tax=Epithele typhae TaxID=378194 RepID=UPI0020072D39|nr:uncharacterized protein BXZ73DRAFT_45531 [Epithele typhae]KAH9935090.1 hypothetical protein BXZ73DRAFT_45531 [Epithele typhae]